VPAEHFSTGFASWHRLLTGGHPNFARLLAVSWAGTLRIHFRGLLHLTEFCHVQNSLCVKVLRSAILAALLHGTPAAGVIQTLRRGNGITELSQTAIFGRAAITLVIGRHSTLSLFHAEMLESEHITCYICMGMYHVNKLTFKTSRPTLDFIRDTPRVLGRPFAKPFALCYRSVICPVLSV